MIKRQKTYAALRLVLMACLSPIADVLPIRMITSNAWKTVWLQIWW